MQLFSEISQSWLYLAGILVNSFVLLVLTQDMSSKTRNINIYTMFVSNLLSPTLVGGLYVCCKTALGVDTTYYNIHVQNMFI